MDKLFSVIMPVYNAEKTLSRAIESVLNDNNDNVELIIVNDGSTDSSESIILKYIDDERLSYYCQKNSGVSTARNYGLSVAKGTYIAFLDSDDFFEKDTFAQLTKYVSKYNCDLIGFGYYAESFTNQNILIKTRTESISQLLNFKTVESEKPLAYLYKSSKVLFQTSWSKVFRKSVIHNNSICFDKNLVCFEDMKFVIDYLTKCESVLLLPNVYYNYCNYDVGGGSLEKRKAIELTSNVSSCFSSFLELADKYNYSNEFRVFMYEQFFADFTYCSQKVFLSENKLSKKDRVRLFSEFLDDEMFLFLKEKYFGNFRFYKVLYMLHNNRLDGLAYYLYKKKIVRV